MCKNEDPSHNSAGRSPADEPEDLYNARVAAHQLLDTIYVYLYQIRDIVGHKLRAQIEHEANQEQDGSVADTKDVDDEPDFFCKMAMKMQQLVEDIIAAHADLDKAFSPLAEEFAHTELVELSGISARSYCGATSEWAWTIVHETFNAINWYTRDEEWDEEWDEELGEEMQHGFTPLNRLAVCDHLADTQKEFHHPNFSHEIIEVESDAVWTARLSREQEIGANVAVGDQSKASVREAKIPSTNAEAMEGFDGGTIVFYSDRVTLCDVDICSGPRSRSKRIVLELLAQQGSDGSFVAYSQSELDAELKREGGRGSASGVIRDLRDRIKMALESEANLVCDRDDVILSGGPGYRFADCLSVHLADAPEAEDITDIEDAEDVPNVRNGDAPRGNVSNDNVPNVRDEGDPDAPDVPDRAAEARQTWILDRLARGDQLKASAVAEHFKCSQKTAHRDLKALKSERKIEYVGTPRTGHYRLTSPPDAARGSG